jgi:hypothetical protein
LLALICWGQGGPRRLTLSVILEEEGSLVAPVEHGGRAGVEDAAGLQALRVCIRLVNCSDRLEVAGGLAEADNPGPVGGAGKNSSGSAGCESNDGGGGEKHGNDSWLVGIVGKRVLDGEASVGSWW